MTYDLELNTEDSFKTYTIRLDGETYTMNPIGSREFFRLMDYAEEMRRLQEGDNTRELITSATKTIFPIVEKLMSPNEKFVEWERNVRERSELAWFMSMSKLSTLLARQMNFDDFVG